MRHLLAIAALLSVASSGCYLGQQRSRKTTAEVISAGAVVVGAGLMLAGHHEAATADDPCDGRDMCYLASPGTGKSFVGKAFIAAGSIALLVNVATPVHADEPNDTVTQPRATTAQVTAPGLKPAAVTIGSTSVVSR
ncbi:MAG TPA: hypothetical protein VGM90_03570 [Kofleriaceae bacterium]|jgi:hypothetical protein